MDRQRKHGWIFTLVNFLVLGVALYLTIRFLPAESPKQVSYSEFLAELRSDKLTDVQITERDLIGMRKADPAHPKSRSELTITATRLPGVDESQLLKELEAHPVKFGGHIDRGTWIWTALGWLLPFVLIGFLYSFGMRRITQGGGALTFGKNRAKIHDESSRLQITFEDVAGVDEAKLELEEIVDFLRQPVLRQ